MKYLEASDAGEFIVKPRWPYKQVAISEEAYRRLQKAQSHLLPHDLRLVLTRGYEYEGAILKRLHQAIRILSAALFCIVYPHRVKECREIFSANGHNHSGDNVDVGIAHKGKLIGLLPNGAFTSIKTILRVQDLYHHALALVSQALEANGFVIHSNKTESLQIHCHLPINNNGEIICK